MTTAHKVPLSLDELIRAIRDGALPEGGAVCDSAYLDMLADALDALDEVQFEYLMEATGGGSSVAEDTAAKLRSDDAPIDIEKSANAASCVSDTSIINVAHRIVFYACDASLSTTAVGEVAGCGFSFAHEVFKGANNAAPQRAESSPAFVWVIAGKEASVRMWEDCAGIGGKALKEAKFGVCIEDWSRGMAISTVGGRTSAQSFRSTVPLAELASLAIANGRHDHRTESESD
jgi:hypothetical protein